MFWSTSAALSVNGTAGYNPSGTAAALTGSSESAYAQRDFPGVVGNSFSIGSRLKVVSAPSAEKVVIGVTNASKLMAVCAAILPDLRVAIYRGNREALLGIYSGPLTTGSHLKFALQGIIGMGSTGSVALWVNGASVWSASGVDTGGAGWAGVYFGPWANAYFSHMYATNSSPIHGYRVDVVHADDANVGDQTPDGDSTTRGADVGGRFTVPIDPPTTRTKILGFMTQSVSKADDDNTGQVHIHTLGGVDYESARRSVTTTYAAIDSDFRSVHPGTGLPLNTSDLTPMTIGIEATS